MVGITELDMDQMKTDFPIFLALQEKAFHQNVSELGWDVSLKKQCEHWKMERMNSFHFLQTLGRTPIS